MYRIATIPGDGTGPEVVREGLKVLEAVSQKKGFKYEIIEYDLGGDRYLKTGEVISDFVIEELKQCNAIFLGAIGHPEVQPGILEKGLLLRLRFDLQQYINLRPVKLYPGVDCPLTFYSETKLIKAGGVRLLLCLVIAVHKICATVLSINELLQVFYVFLSINN